MYDVDNKIVLISNPVSTLYEINMTLEHYSEYVIQGKIQKY